MDHDTLSLLRAGKLGNIRRLDLSCGLTEFPAEIFSLADSLEVLNLSDNQLDSLPSDLYRLHRLQVIFCSNNRFTELPMALGGCTQLEVVGFKANQIETVNPAALPPRLRWLILTDNRIENLPDELGRRPRLQKLMLAGNRLGSLPASLIHCQDLELVRIAANKFEAFPDVLTELPKLAWLAFGGNPFAASGRSLQASAGIPVIDWKDLTLGTVLGEGASGVIHQAVDNGKSHLPVVAVKLFKGAITSDGLPEDEMAACMTAGNHPALVGATAQIGGHPQGRQGLVMPLVDPSMQVLAGPPSLASCTRDVYPPGFVLPLANAVEVARQVASAGAHLHGNGILHGDLYAHNILQDGNGHALLGDFGAASFFTNLDTHQALALQRLEARAFGCLLEELLAHASDDEPYPEIDRLRKRCLSRDVASRPLFAEIHQVLQQWAAVQPLTGFPTVHAPAY